MPDIFAGLSTPKWQSPDESALAWEHASTWIAPVILQGRKLAMEKEQQDAMLPLEIQKQDLQNKSTQARIIGEGFANQKAELDLKNSLEDQASTAEWFQKYPDVESRLDAPIPNLKTPAARLAVTAAQQDAAKTLLGQKKMLLQTGLFKSAMKLISYGGPDTTYMDDDGQLKVNEEALSAGIETQNLKKEKEALALRAVAPTIRADAQTYAADTRYDTAVAVANIRTQEDFAKAANAWQHKALDTLGKADFDLYHEGLITIRQDAALDAPSKARKMALLNQQFKLNSQSSSAVSPAASPAASQYGPDGTVIRQKSTGKTFIIQNGQPVEQP